MKALTMGGLPAEHASHWDKETYQKLGGIVFNLSSGIPDLMLKGYLAYFELKREFMPDEWFEYITELEIHREENGFPTVKELLDRVVPHLSKKGLPEEPKIPTPPLPKPEPMKCEKVHEIINEKESSAQAFLKSLEAKETVEQVCLAL